jgi:hypothetical protein
MLTEGFHSHSHNRARWFWAVALGLLLVFASSTVARAETELFQDLPTKTTINGYTVEYFPQTNLNAADQQRFTFKVTDSTGKPAENLDLQLVAVRDYSGQVKKEHNGPKDPVVGPVKLVSNGKPGEYTTTTAMQFSNNGHWRVYVDSAIFGKERAKFTQSIAANRTMEAGMGWDWLLYPGLVLFVVGTVMFIGSKGVRYYVPATELANANERRD